MKYVVCVPDGCADEPVPELGGRTPLEAAATPVLDRLARRGEVGRAAVIPDGMAPGSDVGNLAILGYDPSRWHTGRAPLEAAAMGLRLRPDQVAYRCNLVTFGPDGTMADFAGGHPASEDAAKVLAALEDEIGRAGVAGAAEPGELSFHPGVQYRHVVVAPAAWGQARCTPPHDLADRPVTWPSGPAAARLRAVMEAAGPIVASAPGPANGIWLWGQGTAPGLPPFRERWGLDGALVTAVDLIRGLGVLAGLKVVEVEGATGWYDTNYEGKREACLDALADGADLFLLHVEATDEAGHAGDLGEKVRALEEWDRRILGPLVEGLDALGPWRLLLVPDHATPVARRTHTAEPVPYLLVDSAAPGPGGVYSEAAVAGRPALPGHQLLARLLGRAPAGDGPGAGG